MGLLNHCIGSGGVKQWVAVFLLAGAALGCGDQAATTKDGAAEETAAERAADDGGQPTLVMIPKATQATFWNQVRSGAEKAAAEFEVNLLWKGPARDNDRAAQKQVVQQFIGEGVDGIILAPTDSKVLAPEATTAMSKGIPVLIYDSALEGEQGKDFISFVATDNLAAGKMGGKKLMELIGEGGKAVLFRHMEGHESTTNRETGALEEFKAAKAEILMENRYSGETSSEAQNAALNMIDVLREADGIFASNQTASEGLLLALRQRNLAGKVKFVGFDSSPLLVDGLRKGEIDALVLQSPVKMGYTSVKMMAEHLRKQSIEPLVDTGAALATKENMDSAEIAELLK
jgi:ribose transport system substrate-binding protein